MYEITMQQRFICLLHTFDIWSVDGEKGIFAVAMEMIKVFHEHISACRYDLKIEQFVNQTLFGGASFDVYN